MTFGSGHRSQEFLHSVLKNFLNDSKWKVESKTYFWITSIFSNDEAIESQPSSFRTLYRNNHSNSSNLLRTGRGIKTYHQQPNTTDMHKHMYYWILILVIKYGRSLGRQEVPRLLKVTTTGGYHISLLR